MPLDGYVYAQATGLPVIYSHGDSFVLERDYRWDWRANPIATLDAAENEFLDRELRHKIAQVLMPKQTAITARTHFPVYYANDPVAPSIWYEEIIKYGRARMMSNLSEDPPLVGAHTREGFTPVKPIRDAWQIDLQEIRAAQKTGRPIQNWRADTARDAMFREENSVAYLGNADFNIPGLFSDTAVPRDGAAQTFAAGTPEQNLAALHDLANDTAAATNHIDKPDTMIMPPTVLDIISVQKLGTLGQSPTVLQDFLATNRHIKSIGEAHELVGAGTGGVDTIVCFKRSIDCIRMNVAWDLEVFPPERKGARIIVELHMRSGGLVVVSKESVRILEEV